MNLDSREAQLRGRAAERGFVASDGATGIATPRDLGVGRRLPDRRALRVIAAARLAILTVLAAGGAFAPVPPAAARLCLLYGLVGVPAATAILFATDRPGRARVVLGGAAVDLAAIGAAMVLLPEHAATTALAFLPAVAIAAFAGTAAEAVVVAVGAVLVALGAGVVAPEGRLAGWQLVMLAVTVTGVVALVRRTLRLGRDALSASLRAQDESHAILAKVADGIVLTDGYGRLQTTNLAARRIVGQSVAAGAHCGALLGLHLGERALDCTTGCALLRLGAGAEADEGLEVWRPGADGRRVPLLANAEAVTDAGGRVLSVVHSLRDITKLKEADEAKTLFLATASHELKTPLTVISGFAQTLLETPDMDEDLRVTALQAMHTRTWELARIVDRLLLTSRIEAGRVELALGETQVGAVVAARVAALAGATGRAIELTLPAELPPALADPDAVVTVFDHLLDNAIKYSPDGGPVEVAATATPDEVLLSVRDHGIGMDDDAVRKCFDKFWQAESGDRRRFGGTGIGLYVVQSLVEAMGGTVTVSSRPGEGSAFVVRLRRPPRRVRARGPGTRDEERLHDPRVHAADRRPPGSATVNGAVAAANLALGLIYTSYGVMTAIDLRRHWGQLGFSHFGVAWLLMAFTCGPHHLEHGWHVAMGMREAGPLDLIAVLVGAPAGVTWFLLRVEGLIGGRGDRFISGTPGWVRALPWVLGAYGLWLAAALLATVRAAGGLGPRYVPNLLLIWLYGMVGWYLLRTQLHNRRLEGGWSMSGLALTVVFPTCAAMHAVWVGYALAGQYAVDPHGLTIDWLAVPAAIYFLWVVRALANGGLRDWNNGSVGALPGAAGPLSATT